MSSQAKRRYWPLVLHSGLILRPALKEPSNSSVKGPPELKAGDDLNMKIQRRRWGRIIKLDTWRCLWFTSCCSPSVWKPAISRYTMFQTCISKYPRWVTQGKWIWLKYEYVVLWCHWRYFSTGSDDARPYARDRLDNCWNPKIAIRPYIAAPNQD